MKKEFFKWLRRKGAEIYNKYRKKKDQKEDEEAFNAMLERWQKMMGRRELKDRMGRATLPHTNASKLTENAKRRRN